MAFRIKMDHALGALRKDLEDAGLKVIPLEQSKVVGRERNDLLHGRILVTNQSHDYRDDADMMNFDIIGTEKLTDIDAGSLAQMIVKAIATHNLWTIQQTYLLHLEQTGLHELEYL